MSTTPEGFDPSTVTLDDLGGLSVEKLHAFLTWKNPALPHAQRLRKDELVALASFTLTPLPTEDAPAPVEAAEPAAEATAVDTRDLLPDERPEDQPGTDLEPIPSGGLPAIGAWQQMEQMAARLARSNLVPSPLRGKPDDVLLVLLGAHDLGISATQGLQKLHVIDGKIAMAAELMVALILREGHHIWPVESSSEKAVVGAQRKGSPEMAQVSFTINDAVNAGLCSIKDGKPHARDRQGRPLPWERYTKSMLWARAVSQMGRMFFADVLAGVSYTPEELGAIVGEDGEPLQGQPVPTTRQAVQPTAADPPITDDQRATLMGRIEALDDTAKTSLREAWKHQEPTLFPLGRLPQSQYDRAGALVATFEPDTPDVEEAELLCPFEGCETFTPGGRYCSDHADADSAEARDEQNAPAAAYVPVKHPDDEPPAHDERCPGCGLFLASPLDPTDGTDAPPLYQDAEGVWWHEPCSPFEDSSEPF